MLSKLLNALNWKSSLLNALHTLLEPVSLTSSQTGAATLRASTQVVKGTWIFNWPCLLLTKRTLRFCLLEVYTQTLSLTLSKLPRGV